MLIFLYGKDNFRRERKKQELLAHYLQKFDAGNLNIDHFDACEHDLATVHDASTASPFLGNKRFISIKAFSQWKDNPDFVTLLKNIPTATIAVFSDEINEQEYQEFQQKIGDIQKFAYFFPTLDASARLTFALEEAKRLEVDLSPIIAKLLISRLSEDTGSIATEIQKLAAHAGKGGVITEHLIDIHLEKLPNDDVFALLDAIFSNNRTRAVRFLLDQYKLDASPFALIGLLARQVCLLIAVKSLEETGVKNPHEIAKTLNVHYFVVQKLIKSTTNRPQLCAFLEKIAQTDSAMKNGKIDSETALIQLIMNAIIDRPQN